ncbi:hypothetical protein F443_14628, partial [Phytophthora nicotianae P1569]
HGGEFTYVRHYGFLLLAPTPMNWYRQFVADCERSQVVRTWDVFKNAMRKRFLPPDYEYMLREILCKLTQTGSLHDYLSACQDILIQCQVEITPLELMFYFQQPLRGETSQHLREHHPQNLEDTIEMALRFDHSVSKGDIRSATADWMKAANCHRCKQEGHIAPQCTNSRK